MSPFCARCGRVGHWPRTAHAGAKAMINTYIIVAAVSAAAAFGTAWKVQARRFDSAKLDAIGTPTSARRCAGRPPTHRAQGHRPTRRRSAPGSSPSPKGWKVS